VAKNRRLFFALWPSDAVRTRLAAEVTAHAGLGRAIPARNLHVTVAFLGSVPEERISRVIEIGKLTVFVRFLLHLDRVEFWRRSNLVCLSAQHTPPELQGLFERLHAGLRQSGFELQAHPTFRPHVTLVRDVARGPATAGIAPLEWPVESLALVESKVGQRGSEYTVLEEWRMTEETGSR
jgi:RNA 2',3'-cyclic 3'-phosphodiesterase